MIKIESEIEFENTEFPEINGRKFHIDYINISNMIRNDEPNVIRIIADSELFTKWFSRVFDEKEYNLKFPAKIYTSDGYVIRCDSVNIASHWNTYNFDYSIETIEFHAYGAHIIKSPENEQNKIKACKDDKMSMIKSYIDDIDKTDAFIKSLKHADKSFKKELYKYRNRLQDKCISAIRNMSNVN